MPAQEDAVVDVGRSAVFVADDVVDFAPLGGDRAFGDEAGAAVSEGDGAALSFGESADGGAQAQRLPVVVEDDGLDASGAGGLFGLGYWDGLCASGEECGADAGFEFSQSGGDPHGGVVAANVGCFRAARLGGADVAEEIGSLLPG